MVRTFLVIRLALNYQSLFGSLGNELSSSG